MEDEKCEKCIKKLIKTCDRKRPVWRPVCG
jgi:hypothetical protein